MTPLEQELAAMLNRLMNGKYCWCIMPKGQHTPTCKDAKALLGKLKRS